MRISICLSLFLHVLMTLVLIKTNDKPPAEPILKFEIIEQKKSSVATAKPIPSKLKSFFPQRNWYKEAKSKTGTWENSDQRVGNYDPLVDSQTYLEGTGALSGNTDLWAFNKYLFERIDSHLSFDSILAQYNHFGSVYVEFTVNPDGTLKSDSLRVVTADKILKVHSLRALRKALWNSFEPIKQNPLGTETLVRAQFSYLRGDPSVNFQKQNVFSKSVFVFKRATNEKPIPTNMADHLLSGGIDYDPFAMAERWQKYKKREFHKSVQFDPLDSYRRDSDYNI